jgi:predicted dehydrogenase
VKIIRDEIKPSVSNILGVGIIGCGLIGKKRASSLGTQGKLLACADIDLSRAQSLALPYDAVALDDWRDLLIRSDIDIVIVSTLHDSLAEITLAAINSGKYVLVEKPAARSAEELVPVIAAAKKSNIKVHVGFNHRYHRSLQKAKSLINTIKNFSHKVHPN